MAAKNASGQSVNIQLNNSHPKRISEEYVPAISDELNEVREHTDEAANRIMEAVEKIQKEIAALPPEAAEKVQAQFTEIFEACNFQDITGQRITNVLQALNDIDDVNKELVKALGECEAITIEASETKSAKEKAEENLLGGPQLEDDAPSQDDIDALFANS